MADGSATEQRWWVRAGIWLVLAAAVYFTGVCGYLNLHQLDPAPAIPHTLSRPEAFYRGLRLFTLNVDLPDRTQAPPWLWVAAFLAPVLLASGVVALLWARVSRVLVRLFARPRLVVFGANINTTALVRATTADVRKGGWAKRMWKDGWWRLDVVVVVDADAQALADTDGDLVHTVAGEGVGAAVLRQAAVRRATEVVVATGDAVRNSAITSALLRGTRTPPQIDVEITDASLAESLEQGHLRSGVTVTAFDPTGVTAMEVLDVVGRHVDPHDKRPPGILVFGTGPLVDAFVLELFRRRSAWHNASAARIPRVVVFGPEARDQCADLTGRMVGEGLEPDLEPITVDLDPSSELSSDTTRHVDRYATQLVLVAVPRYHEGGHIAFMLRRRFPPEVPIALVTQLRDDPFGSNDDDWRKPPAPGASGVRVFSVAQCGYDPMALAANRLVERLARGLYEAEPRDSDPQAPERKPWTAPDAVRDAKRAAAETLRDDLAASHVPLRRSAATALSTPETPLIKALGVPEPGALPLAGVRVDFTAPAALVAAALKLIDPTAAFDAWCEVARLRAVAADLAADHPANGPDDVKRLLLLRRAALGDDAARQRLPSVSGIPIDRRVVVLIGDPPADILPKVERLLEPTLRQVADPPTIFHVGDPARTHALGAGMTSVPATAASGRGPALDLWTAIVKSDDQKPVDVRVLLLPDAPADQILLARALDARIGQPWWTGEPDTGTPLLGGPIGIIPLPPDRMTIRAFLHPAPAHAKRDAIAAELHRRYLIHQRDRKDAKDPAMRPFNSLVPWLRESNRAQADDIPNKLAVVNLGYDADPSVPHNQPWPASVDNDDRELLAEMEHGRFTAERIQSGWALAKRDVGRFMTPHLVPWEELPDDIKKYDREFIDDLPEVLAFAGLKLRPA